MSFGALFQFLGRGAGHPVLFVIMSLLTAAIFSYALIRVERFYPGNFKE